MSDSSLLRLEDLCLHFQQGRIRLPALRNLNLTVAKGEIVALVGESGCGKSLTARAILGLPPENAHVQGHIWFEERDLLTLSEKSLQAVRGAEISMIFQEPMTALNPVLTCGRQCAEVLETHTDFEEHEIEERVIEIFARCGITEPKRRFESYPHQLSGGLRQRVMIAMALLCNPHMLLADEPTTALDSTMQQQILDLIVESVKERAMSCIMISHDLDAVRSFSDMVCVMYAGSIVEKAPSEEIFSHPLHPYTRGLLHSSPRRATRGQTRLPMIAGSVPQLGQLPKGCPFAPRCESVMEECTLAIPPLKMTDGHLLACYR